MNENEIEITTADWQNVQKRAKVYDGVIIITLTSVITRLPGQPATLVLRETPKEVDTYKQARQWANERYAADLGITLEQLEALDEQY